MRTIKFRGKDLQTGEWRYGYLYQLQLPNVLASMILVGDNVGCEFFDDSSDYHLAFTLGKDLFAVRTDTLGQFTGLQDSNGNDIYEGDLVKFIRHNWKVEGRPLVEELEHICVIYYNEERHAFWMWYDLGIGSASGMLDFEDERCEKITTEIIGNIFDTPELLKGGEKWKKD